MPATSRCSTLERADRAFHQQFGAFADVGERRLQFVRHVPQELIALLGDVRRAVRAATPAGGRALAGRTGLCTCTGSARLPCPMLPMAASIWRIGRAMKTANIRISATVIGTSAADCQNKPAANVGRFALQLLQFRSVCALASVDKLAGVACQRRELAKRAADDASGSCEFDRSLDPFRGRRACCG